MNACGLVIIIIALIAYIMRPARNYSGGNTNTRQLVSKFNDIDGRLPYNNACAKKPIIHNGQLKLFLTELQFMTSCMNDNHDEMIFIYAGSAPSNKLSYLMELFPRSKFVLVDPNEHYIKYGKCDQYDVPYRNNIIYFQAGKIVGIGPGYDMRKKSHNSCGQVMTMQGLISRQNDIVGTIPDNICEIITSSSARIFIIENYFDDELATKLSGLDAMFISDIRTSDSDRPQNIDILWNSALMYNWISILKPRKYMLKFRCPWPNNRGEIVAPAAYQCDAFKKCPINFIDNYNNNVFEFAAGEIYLQAFAPFESAETRLVGTNNDIITYDMCDYEERMFYFNKIIRPSRCETMRDITKNNLCIDKCMDCANLFNIFDEYSQKYGIKINIFGEITRMLAMISRNVCGNGHGKLL